MKEKTKKTIELVYFLDHIINQKNLLKFNQSMILSVSGGQDSITLFFIFLQLKEQWNWKYKLLYCNHLWQKDSFYTILHLFKLAYLLNIPIYFTFTLQKIFTEQFARNWRSLTFQRITEFYFLHTIITGHSKSDRVETGLFNLFRGSSTKGVSSLNWTKVVIKERENLFKINKKALNLFYIKNCASIIDVDISCFITYCNIRSYNQKWRLVSKVSENNRKMLFFCYFSFNLFGSKQSQLKQLVQYYLQLVLWKKEIQTVHSTKQNRKKILELLLRNLAVKCFTLGFSRPFKKSEDFVIKRFYIYKVDCMKCKLLGVDAKRNFEKKTNFLKKIRNCFCFFKGNAVFFCFSPLQKSLR